MVAGNPGDQSATEFDWQFNMADYFLYDRLDEGKGDHVALRTVDDSWTYREVAIESDRFGNVLQTLDLRPEDRLLIALPDVPEFVFSIFGTLRVGGVVAMTNPLSTDEETAYHVDYTRCRVLVCSQQVAEHVAEHDEDFDLLEHVIVVDGTPPEGERFHAWTDLVEGASPNVDPWPTTRNDPAYWLFTSGSTGEPKAVVHLHHDFPWNCERYAKQVLAMDEDDVTLSVPRLYFGYATGTNLFFPFAVGATACLFPEKPTPEVLLDRIEHFEPTILTTVPTSINQVVNHEDAAEYDLSSLRFALSAGEALPEEVFQAWMELYGVEILDGIGSAESFHIYITNYPNESVRGSLGRLVPGYGAEIVDADDNPVDTGETGRLKVKGDSIGVGYWQAHEESKQTFVGEWLVTSDLFHRDEDGLFYYDGRADDVMKVSGMFVSPLEIEDALLTHDTVEEVAVVDYEDEGLEKPIAFVAPTKRADGDDELARELASYAKQELTRYKFPRRVAFVDALPRNDRGKVERKTLRRRARSAEFEGWHNTDTETLRRARDEA